MGAQVETSVYRQFVSLLVTNFVSRTLNDLQFSLFEVARRLSQETKTEILVIAGGVNSRNQLTKWMCVFYPGPYGCSIAD